MNYADSRSTMGDYKWVMPPWGDACISPRCGEGVAYYTTYIFSFFRLSPLCPYHHFLTSMLFHRRWSSSHRFHTCSDSHAHPLSLTPLGLTTTECQRNAHPGADWPQNTSINEHTRPAFPVVNGKWNASWIIRPCTKCRKLNLECRFTAKQPWSRGESMVPIDYV